VLVVIVRIRLNFIGIIRLTHTSVFNILDNELAEKFCNVSFDMVLIRVGEISPLLENPGPRDRPE
jgi:hypothetical protein